MLLIFSNDRTKMNLTKLPDIRALIDIAINEDLILGDITSDMLISSDQESEGIIIAKEPCVVAGQDIAEYVFHRIDSATEYRQHISDSKQVENREIIAAVSGRTKSILAAERLALNFLQRLSGIATAASLAVDRIKDSDCMIVDTRKTTPGWRILEKYAVQSGGGRNHRMSLGDGILIKDNHIKAVGGVREAVKIARKEKRHPLIIEIEVTSVDEAEIAVDAGADALLLDNMTQDQLKKIANRWGETIQLEISGNVRLDNLEFYAIPGINLISMGSITHSARSVDFSLNLT